MSPQSGRLYVESCAFLDIQSLNSSVSQYTDSRYAPLVVVADYVTVAVSNLHLFYDLVMAIMTTELANDSASLFPIGGLLRKTLWLVSGQDLSNI